MKRSDDTGFENRELSIDELDGVAAAGLFSWVAHEVSSAAKWLGSEFAKAENAVASALGSSRINITIHRQN
jgi:high-affinity Fe2+/Pb2+ permease